MSDLATTIIVMIDLCLFLLAFIVNCILYICIVSRMSKRKTRMKSLERNHVAKMLGINASVFVICLALIQIRNMIVLWADTSCIEGELHFFLRIASVTSSLNSAVNPLIYNAFIPTTERPFAERSLV